MLDEVDEGILKALSDCIVEVDQQAMYGPVVIVGIVVNNGWIALDYRPEGDDDGIATQRTLQRFIR